MNSGGLKLVYIVYIRLKMDFPWYAAEVHGAEAFLERRLTAAQLPPQSAELFRQLQCRSRGPQQMSEQLDLL